MRSAASGSSRNHPSKKWMKEHRIERLGRLEEIAAATLWLYQALM
jgi:hypothetical protein